MSSQFDPRKNAANIAKHGVSLSEGDGVRLDPLAIVIEDIDSQGEQRWVTIGTNVFGEVLVVVSTDRDDADRMISVRKPTSKERRDYET